MKKATFKITVLSLMVAGFYFLFDSAIGSIICTAIAWEALDIDGDVAQ